MEIPLIQAIAQTCVLLVGKAKNGGKRDPHIFLDIFTKKKNINFYVF